MIRTVLQVPALANADGPYGEPCAWIGAYDSFLGYMAGVLPLLTAGQKGFEPL